MTGMQPPQTPLGPASRAMATPHKTPFRTPLRTPGGGTVRGEQLSHTPVIDFEAIEQHKENVQPLARGRSAHALTAALSQRHAELKAQRAELEAIVTSQENADADDPLEAWARYVKWCIDSFPGGQTSESGLVLLLERCTRLFRQSTQYRNDSRYLRLWILYARNVDCPADVYNFLLANEIGTALASLYEELAAVYETQEAHDKADETFRVGIHRAAQPIDRLKRRYKEYQARVLSAEGRSEDADRQTYKAALASAMAKAQRSMLGSKTGVTSASANTLRGQNVQAGLAQADTGGGNLKRPALFKDADGDKASIWSKGKPAGSWADIGTAASRKQERDPEARQWKGEVLPQRDASATPRRAVIRVYRDSDDEGEDGESPVKERTADVFSKSSEPSETDKLRRNPFLHYAESELKAESQHTQRSTSSRATSTADASSKRKDAERQTQKKEASTSKSSTSNSKSNSSKAQKKEHYAVPVERLYPGISLEQVGQRSSSKKRSHELPFGELMAAKYLPESSSSDPWAYLDARQGTWLPELESRAIVAKAPKLMKRDPTVTAFTRAAQDEVMEMFNGGAVESDEDDSSDEESDSDEDDDIKAMPEAQVRAARVPHEVELDEPIENGARAQPERNIVEVSAQISGENAAQSTHLTSATPLKKPFGGDRNPLRAAPTHLPSFPQRLDSTNVDETDDDDSQEDLLMAQGDDEMQDYMNRPMCELAPLSPITEATECTRTTALSRTPGTSTSSRFAGRSWTPSSRIAHVYEEEAHGESEEEGDESHLAQHIHQDDGARGRSSLRGGPEAPSAQDKQIVQIPSTSMSGPLCPVDAQVIETILGNLDLPVESSADFVDCSTQRSCKLGLLQKHAAQVSKRRSSGHTQSSANPSEWTLQILEYQLRIRSKLGEGGYGAVFLAEDPSAISGKQRVVGGINGDASFADLGEDAVDDSMSVDLEPKLIAVKVESPPNRWEFYILGQLRARLADDAARLSSIICARKFFCFQDESFLLLEYGDKGTLLEIVNNAVNAGVASSSALGLGTAVSMAAASNHASSAGSGVNAANAVGIDEILAMFFTVEVIKLVEALHAADLLHGDLKIDNCLLRLDDDSGEAWTHAYSRHGDDGWGSRGITLIDFGRAVDLRRFAPGQRFIADWTPEANDMPQIHRGETWRHEIDYFGIASIAYCLLFGKYIGVVESTREGDAFCIDRPLRRYWQVDTWNSLFALCLNCPSDAAQAATMLHGVRDRMETWLEDNCFRAGKNLKGSLKKLEIWSMKRGSSI